MDRFFSLIQMHPGFRLARYELALYRDLLWWIRGHQLVPDGALALPHPPGRLQMLASVIAVLCVEMVVVHLLLPAGTVRILALLVSFWGVAYVASLIASERIRPSYIADDEMVLRRGRLVFVQIPASHVLVQRYHRTFASEIALSEGALTVGGPGGTDTLVELSEAIAAAGDRYPWQKARPQMVTKIYYYAGTDGKRDQPSASCR